MSQNALSKPNHSKTAAVHFHQTQSRKHCRSTGLVFLLKIEEELPLNTWKNFRTILKKLKRGDLCSFDYEHKKLGLVRDTNQLTPDFRPVISLEICVNQWAKIPVDAWM